MKSKLLVLYHPIGDGSKNQESMRLNSYLYCHKPASHEKQDHYSGDFKLETQHTRPKANLQEPET